MALRFVGIAVVALGVIVSACAPATGNTTRGGTEALPAAPKRIVAAIMADPPVMARVLNPGSHWRGIEHIQVLVAGGLTGSGGGNRYPELAEAVPSPDNGLWKINPDGTMETTWHIKNRMQWHDGTPFTSADLFFTMQVVMDKEVPLFGADGIFNHISGYDAPDARTMVVRWKDPYIDADSLFGSSVSPGDQAVPMAKHILQRSYPSNKAGFGDDPYWSAEYVGTGPFMLKSWQPGSNLVVTANDHYVLGRPKVDEVEFRFIEDAGTLQANLLANTVDMTLGRNLSGPQSLEVTNQWPNGQLYIDYTGGSIQEMFVQLRNPEPPIMTNVTFRKAALLALDRQSMVDSLMGGQTRVADSFILPGQEPYRDIEAKYTVKYPYDQRQSLELLQGIGYIQGADGFLRDGAGTQLAWLARTTAGDDLREKILLISADNWKRAGMNVSTYVIPRQQADDAEYRANFPAMELVRQPGDINGTRNLHSRTTSLPENSFKGTGNRARYFNKDLDDLIDRLFTTISLPERREVLGQIDHILTTDVPFFMVMYATGTFLVSNRVVNFKSDGPWNSYQWDLR